MRLHNILLLMMIYTCGAAQVKREMKKTEPKRPEPARRESMKPEPKKAESRRPEPARRESTRSEAKTVEPRKSEPPVKAGSRTLESRKVEPRKSAPMPAEPVRPGPKNPESKKRIQELRRNQIKNLNSYSNALDNEDREYEQAEKDVKTVREGASGGVAGVGVGAGKALAGRVQSRKK